MKLIYQMLWILFYCGGVIVPAQKNVENIIFEYKVLNKKECKRLFKTKKILKKGHQPIQITVTNYSDNAIVVSPQGLNIPTIPADTVLAALHKNGFARGVPLGLVGIIAGLPLPMLMLLPPAVFMVSSLCVITFFYSSNVYWIWSYDV
jgi:hypothetical protein